MSEQAVVEYAMAVRARYLAARKLEEGRILDEFCAATGMHRKAVIRLLNRRTAPGGSGRGQPQHYGPEVSAALVQVWQASDRMCGKLLAAVMPDLVAALECQRPDQASHAPSRESHVPFAEPQWSP
jgi:hypothetical protein